MKKKSLLLFAAVLAVCISMPLAFVPLLPESRITKENFSCIQNGMTKGEVEVILGPSMPRGADIAFYAGEIDPAIAETACEREWFGPDNVGVSVWFDDDRVVFKSIGVVQRLTFREKVRQWLHFF